MATTHSPEPPAEAGPPRGEAGRPGEPTVDVRRLAEKVYRLMLADLRLEQARGARGRPRE
jgi:hypothetical protein